MLLAAWVTIGLSGCGLCRPGMYGCGATVGCGCDVGCDCALPCECGDDCCCEPACGCEPDCGCDPGCGVSSCTTCGPGRSWALKRWKGDCNCQGPKINVCTGGCCCDAGPSCCAEPSCCSEDLCCDDGCCGDACCDEVGCCDTCGNGCGCGFRRGWGVWWGCFRDECRRLCGPLNWCGCGGCDGELYWHEWHNDPPRCCDPCNDCGDWVGPSVANNRETFGDRMGSSL